METSFQNVPSQSGQIVYGGAYMPASLPETQKSGPEPTEELSPVTQLEQEPVFVPVEIAPVDDTEFGQLKTDINDSFAEIASLILELQQRFTLLDERLENYNRKSSHKI